MSNELALRDQLRPFEQPDFDSLPEEPRRPHAYHDAEALDLVVEDSHFGEIGTHVRRMGDGPPLLLIHGLMTSSYSWRYVFEPLAEHYTVWAPDLPGAGRTDKVTDVSYGPLELAE